MRQLLIASLTLCSLTLFLGCQHKSEGSMETTKSQSSMGQDDCPMCAGVQHAKPDGTCPVCGMQVKKANNK